VVGEAPYILTVLFGVIALALAPQLIILWRRHVNLNKAVQSWLTENCLRFIGILSN